MLEIWSTAGKRLGWSVHQKEPEHRQSGLRLFQRKLKARSDQLAALEEPRLVGIGLSSLRDYVAGRAEPSLRFLEESATILGVRRSWLICNQGSPKEAFDQYDVDEVEASLGERLKWAIKEHPHEGRRSGRRLFQRNIERRSNDLADLGEPKLVGTSLSSVNAYVADEAEPSIRFLQEAAEVLRVRRAWLICNHGPPKETPRQDLDDPNRAGSDPAPDVALTLMNSVLKAIGASPAITRRGPDRIEDEGDIKLPLRSELEDLPGWVGPLVEVRGRLREMDILLDPIGEITAHRLGDHSAEEAVREGMGLAIGGPLRAWDVDPAQMSRRVLTDYIIAMAPALLLLANERNRQRQEDLSLTAPPDTTHARS